MLGAVNNRCYNDGQVGRGVVILNKKGEEGAEKIEKKKRGIKREKYGQM